MDNSLNMPLWAALWLQILWHGKDNKYETQDTATAPTFPPLLTLQAIFNICFFIVAYFRALAAAVTQSKHQQKSDTQTVTLIHIYGSPQQRTHTHTHTHAQPIEERERAREQAKESELKLPKGSA